MNKAQQLIKAFIIGLLVFRASCLIAGAMGNLDELPLQNRFYFGGDIGAANFIDKEMHTVNPETHQLGSVGIIGGGYIGYDYQFMPQFHGSLELFGDATGFNLAISHPSTAYQIKQRYDIGLRVLPTYFITPQTAAHVILGYVNGGFKLHDNGTYGYINERFNQSGFQTGLGLTNEIYQSFLIRVDGIYNIFGHQNLLGTTSNGQYQTYCNTFSSFIGELSLIYQFM